MACVFCPFDSCRHLLLVLPRFCAERAQVTGECQEAECHKRCSPFRLCNSMRMCQCSPYSDRNCVVFLFAMSSNDDHSSSCRPECKQAGLVLAGYDWKSFRLLISHFWHRLLGTGGIWFCNDWYFYGMLICFIPVDCRQVCCSTTFHLK